MATNTEPGSASSKGLDNNLTALDNRVSRLKRVAKWLFLLAAAGGLMAVFGIMSSRIDLTGALDTIDLPKSLLKHLETVTEAKSEQVFSSPLGNAVNHLSEVLSSSSAVFVVIMVGTLIAGAAFMFGESGAAGPLLGILIGLGGIVTAVKMSSSFTSAGGSLDSQAPISSIQELIRDKNWMGLRESKYIKNASPSENAYVNGQIAVVIKDAALVKTSATNLPLDSETLSKMGVEQKAIFAIEHAAYGSAMSDMAKTYEKDAINSKKIGNLFKDIGSYIAVLSALLGVTLLALGRSIKARVDRLRGILKKQGAAGEPEQPSPGAVEHKASESFIPTWKKMLLPKPVLTTQLNSTPSLTPRPEDDSFLSGVVVGSILTESGGHHHHHAVETSSASALASTPDQPLCETRGAESSDWGPASCGDSGSSDDSGGSAD